MKEIHRQNTDIRKHYTVRKTGTGCGNVKLLYAGELKKTSHWQEQLHSHAFYEVVFVRSGTGVLHTQTTQTVIREGDLLIYAPGAVHSESCLQNEALSLWFFGIDRLHLKDDLENTIINGNDIPILKTNDLKDDLEKYFSLLIGEVQNKSYYSDDISHALVKIILNLALRLLAQNDEKNLQTNESYLYARKFIDENYETIESIEDVCKSVYISRYYLTHLFKECSGMSPIQYIISKRIEKAKDLLASTSLSIQKIAQLTGYAEETSFLKTFKKTENMTPSEFRKNNRIR